MKVLLCCYGGLSTGIMKKKIEDEAVKDGINDLEIKAVAISEAMDNPEDYDVYLLGPQVRYAADDFKKVAGSKPVIVISPTDFGMMRADAVWKQIKKELN